MEPTGAPFRCVHVVPETGAAGAENQALYLLRELRRRGDFELELVCFAHGHNHERFLDLGIPVHHIPRRGRLLLDFPRRVRGLRRLYRAHPPALLHSWLFEANVVSLTAARGLPETRVVLAQRSGTMERAMRWHLFAMRRLYPRADHAISNSREGADLLAELGLPEPAITVIPQGVDLDRVALRRIPAEVRMELRVAEDTPLVVTAGRADQTKDLPGLLRAMEVVWMKRPDAVLAFVGPTREELRALGLELSQRVRAVGWQSRPAEFLAAADVVAIPSWTEGNSNVAAEALMLGRPVATTDTGDHPRIVGEAGGRVVPVRRPDLLGSAIEELLAAPPLAAKVLEVATRRLSPTPSVEATLRVYERLLSRHEPVQ